MKMMLVLFTFYTSNVFAVDCGVYTFKGVLRESKTSELKFHYVVNEQTKSQMTFEFKDSKDLGAMLPLLNKPSSFKGKIGRRMDGTKGVLTNIEGINERFPNPLAESTADGLGLVTKMKCD